MIDFAATAAGQCTRNEGTHVKTDIAIDVVFTDRVEKRTQVVFRELLSVAERHAKQHPDRELVDLLSRARAISASFDTSAKSK